MAMRPERSAMGAWAVLAVVIVAVLAEARAVSRDAVSDLMFGAPAQSERRGRDTAAVERQLLPSEIMFGAATPPQQHALRSAAAVSQPASLIGARLVYVPVHV